MTDRADALRQAIGIAVDAQVHAGLDGTTIPEGDHLAKLPRGIHVQQRDRRARRMEGLEQQVQQHRTVLADRIQQHRVAELGRHLAHDVDAFGFELVEVGQSVVQGGHRSKINVRFYQVALLDRRRRMRSGAANVSLRDSSQ